MYVYGWLRNAQLENSAGNPTPVSTGRIYIDTTVPAVSVPQVYDGTNWRVFALNPLGSTYATTAQLTATNVAVATAQLDAASFFDAGSSGATKTIDWSNGVVQKVLLTANCVFTFTNPIAGRELNLIILQDATVPYFYRLPAAIHYKHTNVLQPLIHPRSQNTLSFVYNSGIMTNNLTISTSFPNPPALPSGVVNSIAISPSGRYVLIGTGITPFIHLYTLVDGPQGPILGQRAANPATLPTGIVMCVAWAPNEDYVGCANTTTPFCAVYPFIPGTLAFGVKITNPGTLPAGNGTAIAWTKGGDAIVVGCATTPFIISYPFASGTFGTAHTAPVTTPAGTVSSIDFQPIHLSTLATNTFIALGMAVTPFIAVYAYTAGAGVGVKSTDPVTLPAGAAGSGHSVAWSPQGDYLAHAGANNPFIAVYPVSQAGVFGTKVADAATLPTGAASGLTWTPDGDFLIVAHATTPFMSWYPFVHTGSGSFGVKLTDSASTPPAACVDVAVAPNNEAVFLGSGTTPFVKTHGSVRNAKDYVFLIQ